MPTASRCNRHLSRAGNETPIDFFSFSTCYVIIESNEVKFFFSFSPRHFAIFFQTVQQMYLRFVIPRKFELSWIVEKRERRHEREPVNTMQET